MGIIVNISIQVIVLIFLAPLLAGLIKKIKAGLQNRKGPSIFQLYRDIFKYMKKDSVISQHSSWIFLFTPYIVWTSILLAGLLVPTIYPFSPLASYGDLIVLVYLLTVARFFMALAALDTGSSFGGMGASREMAVSSMVEPALFMAIAALALLTKTTDLSSIVIYFSGNPSEIFTPSFLLLLIAFYLILITETGRIPVDNPDTHLELTMIHEGMLLEYSGKSLGLMLWASAIKQLIIFSIMANVFFPWGVSTVYSWSALLSNAFFYVMKITFIGVIVAFTEISFAKMRFFQIPELLTSSLVISFLAIIMQLSMGGK